MFTNLNMTVFYFKNWQTTLENSSLDPSLKRSFTITIRWYISYLIEMEAKPTLVNARTFMIDKVKEKQAQESTAQIWRRALNWFFKNAPIKKQVEDLEGKNYFRDKRQTHAVTIRDYQRCCGREPLLEDTVKLMRIRNLAYKTEQTYLGWLRRWNVFLPKVSMDQYTERHLKEYLTALAVEEHVSGTTQRQALNACVFFLREVRGQELGDFSDFTRANKKKYYPQVFSQGEMMRILENLRGRWLLMAQLQYGCGLRVSELCRLRIKDIDFDRGRLFVRAGKGDKDRVLSLPKVSIEGLREQVVLAKGVFMKDRAEGVRGVHLPNAMDRKDPNAGKKLSWFWLFPSQKCIRDPREPELEPRRHHLLPAVYQRQLSAAGKRAGIVKLMNSHLLRHSYATHLLENGVNLREVQDRMGHKSIETTMIYLHVMQDKNTAPSPIDLWMQK